MAELEEHLPRRRAPLVDRRRLRCDSTLGGDRDDPARHEAEPILEPDAAELEGRERRRRRDRRTAEPGVERTRELRVADPQARVRDAAAARQQVERELDRLEVRVARDSPEVRRRSRWPLPASAPRPAHAPARSRRSAASTSQPRRASAFASAIESSIASFVPDPIEKCAVWAASPRSDDASVVPDACS